MWFLIGKMCLEKRNQKINVPNNSVYIYTGLVYDDRYWYTAVVKRKYLAIW